MHSGGCSHQELTIHSQVHGSLESWFDMCVSKFTTNAFCRLLEFQLTESLLPYLSSTAPTKTQRLLLGTLAFFLRRNGLPFCKGSKTLQYFPGTWFSLAVTLERSSEVTDKHSTVLWESFRLQTGSSFRTGFLFSTQGCCFLPVSDIIKLNTKCHFTYVVRRFFPNCFPPNGKEGRTVGEGRSTASGD